ncbi:MAG: TerB family tellurite resistance protein [Archangium sp.]
MTVRKILSARGARSQVEGMLDALVEAAAFIGRADGRFGEEELETFIDSMREVVRAAVGDEFLDTLGATSGLLDRARRARRMMLELGREKYLEQLAPKFPGAFARDGLVLAYRIVLADGEVTPAEADAFEQLAKTLGVEVEETQVLKELATRSEVARLKGATSESVDAVLKLSEKGWARRPASDAYDAAVHFGAMTLELDAKESALDVFVRDPEGNGPHFRCLFGENVAGLLAVLDSMKIELTPATLGEKLPAIRAVCPEVFVAHQGKFAKL